MKHLLLMIIVLIFHPDPDEAVIVMDVPGYPLLIELDKGDSYQYKREWDGKRINHTVELLDYKLFMENNYWFDKETGQENIYKAEVHIKFDKKDTVLYARPYQMPIQLGDIRIGIETIKEWENHGNLEPVKITNLEKQVRLSLAPSSAPYAPETLRFPIRNYIWHASSYYNTWNSLVPYNHRYYHRGEDMAAIPDVLPVVAMMDGQVVKSPLPHGDGASNGWIVETASGVRYRYGHIDLESFVPGLDSGVHVRAGQQVGRTGQTWNGGKNQYSGPHLHVEMQYNGTTFNAFPAMMQAYFRDYPDTLVSIAGGYRFTDAGNAIELDGSRSLVREGHSIASYKWITHQGDTINSAIGTIVINEPGLYSEQLLVTTTSGAEDRDFLQIRVYDPGRGKNIISRHVMYSPVRNIAPGDSVLFWNRLDHTHSPVQIDFGDKTNPRIIDQQLYHIYHKPGNYVVTYSATGPDGEQGTIQVEVKVHEK